LRRRDQIWCFTEHRYSIIIEQNILTKSYVKPFSIGLIGVALEWARRTYILLIFSRTRPEHATYTIVLSSELFHCRRR
jgi:hypothetical protein